jgi:zinc protease
VAASKLPAILANNDWRFGIPGGAILKQRSFAEAKAVLAPLAKDAPIEIGIVGAIDEDAAIAAVARSFGALPMRAPTTPAYAEARKAWFRKDRTPIELTHEGPVDQALVAAFWPTDDDSDYRREVGLGLLARVLDLMLTESVREQLGASYGVNVSSSMSNVFTDFGSLSVSAIVAPDKTGTVEEAIAAAVKQLRDAPISADLLDRARNPALEAISKDFRENGFWMSYVDEAQGQPDRLERIRHRRALHEAITPAELQTLAQTYLVDGMMQRVRIVSDDVAAKAKPTAAR